MRIMTVNHLYLYMPYKKKENTCMFCFVLFKSTKKKKNHTLSNLQLVLLSREIASKDMHFLQIVPVVTTL